jgi:hypothetical protein
METSKKTKRGLFFLKSLQQILTEDRADGDDEENAEEQFSISLLEKIRR